MSDSQHSATPPEPSAGGSSSSGAAPKTQKFPPGYSENDFLRILVATDNHLGVHERDHIRGNDSFVTFQEILDIAVSSNVDFVLLGGDLFHENKPSRSTLLRTMTMLRSKCMGSKPIRVRIHSDQAQNFHSSATGTVNWEDENYNIGLPVFSIHGNHDDPSGSSETITASASAGGGSSQQAIAALDILAAANLVNYFGRQDNFDDIKIQPILMSKGKTNLALYGLGNIRDERLFRAFRDNKVKLYRPADDINSNKWFNVMVLHQNRNRPTGTAKNISESMLRGFLDLVIWGHEHECLVKPVRSAEGDFEITQPGSSVATSLDQGETKPKHVALLDIIGPRYRMRPIKLKTVRPFLFEDVVLSSHPDLGTTEADKANKQVIEEFLAGKVSDLIEKCKTDPDIKPSDDALRKNKTLDRPLIRLRVDYSGGYATINPQRFGQRFEKQVANPKDLLVFYRSRASADSKRRKEEGAAAASGAAGGRRGGFDEDDLRPEPMDQASIEDLVVEFLRGGSKHELSILDEASLLETIQSFVDKSENSAFSDFLTSQLKEAQMHVWNRQGGFGNPSEQQGKVAGGKDVKVLTSEEIEGLIQERAAKLKRQDDLARSKARQDRDERVAKQLKEAAANLEAKEEGDEDEQDEEEQGSKKKGKAAAKTTAKAKGKGKAKAVSEDDEEEEENDGDDFMFAAPASASSPAKRGGRGRGASSSAAATGRGRGRGKGRGAAAAASSSSSRKALAEEIMDEDDDDEVVQEKPKAAASNKRGRAGTLRQETIKFEAPAASQRGTMQEPETIISSDEDSAPSRPSKRAKPSAAASASSSRGAKKSKTVVEDDDEEEQEFVRPSSRKPSAAMVDDEDEDDGVSLVSSTASGGSALSKKWAANRKK